MGDSLRVFIGFKLPDTVLERLQAINSVLQPEFGSAARWVSHGNLHLTLVFMGYVIRQDLDALRSVVRQVASSAAPVSLSLGDLGCFPNGKNAKVFWAGLEAVPQELRALRADLVDACAPYAPELDTKSFSPHVTLARAAARNKIPFEAFGAEIQSLSQSPPIEWLAKSITLYQSKLSSKGALYLPIEEFHLGC